MRRLFRPLVALPCFALLALAGCGSEPAAPVSPYDVFLVRGCATDIEHETYDPGLPGFWLVGTEATTQVSLAKDAVIPDEFVFMLRTRATATKENPTRLAVVKFQTPRYWIFTSFDAKGTAPVDIISYQQKKEGTEIVPVESDKAGRFIRFEQVGERVKVTLTGKGLALLGRDFTLSWSETPAKAGTPAAEVQNKAEAKTRRMM